MSYPESSLRAAGYLATFFLALGVFTFLYGVVSGYWLVWVGAFGFLVGGIALCEKLVQLRRLGGLEPDDLERTFE